MRAITETQWRSLEDLSAEGLLGGLSPQIAEKDIHITELLELLSNLEVRHDRFKGLVRGETAIDDGIRLVFAGGTCLSKAHNLISRMSEDVDVKIVLSAPSRELKNGIGARARLKALHREVVRTLDSLDLNIPAELNGVPNPKFRDERRYCIIGAAYKSKGPPALSLRPELKLEMIHREPTLATSKLEFGYLYERVAGLKPSRSISMSCISVGETLAEKVLSFLRRCALEWAELGKGKADLALVRHVYDVHQIANVQPLAINAAAQVFSAVVEQDAAEFWGQHPAFDDDPIGVLWSTLDRAKTNVELRARYQAMVVPLIFDQRRPTYETAFATFESTAAHLLTTVS